MRSTNKIESIQDRVLQLLYNDYTRTYHSLLAKANKPSMELKRYRTLALEIFKTLKILNPTYMHYLFIYALHPQDNQTERKALDHWDLRFGILYQNI